jgi:ectoine hydroxylase-related dioxygenase (phytanoyl-CoA dioxygenase family)
MSDHIYELRTKGFTVLRGALDVALVARMIEAVDRLLAEDDRTWGAENLEAMHERGALRNLCDLDPVFAELLAASPAMPIVEQLLGDRFVLNCFDALVLFPGQGRYPWDFHTDVLPLANYATPAETVPAVNVIYYLGDVDRANGATWFVPGSHRCVSRAVPTEMLADFAESVQAGPGDVLLNDARAWHCAGANTSSEYRPVVKSLFTAPWFRPQMDFTRAVAPDVLATLDDRTRGVLGVGHVPPTSVAELRRVLSGEPV